MHRATIIAFAISAFSCLTGIGSTIGSAQQTKKPFTVADDIGLAYFGDPNYSYSEEAVHASPDGNYFAVHTERGRGELNRLEDSLRFYRSEDIQRFLNHSDESQRPSPVWVVNRSGKEGPTINSNWRWLADSSGVAFLERTSVTSWRIVLANLRKKTTEALTSATETVKDFDLRDRQHFVYTATDSIERKKMQDERHAPAMVGTGRSLVDLLLPDDSVAVGKLRFWAVVDGKRLKVKHDGAPLVPAGDFALSPDGSSLVTVMPVPEVPPSWESLYAPPFASSLRHVRAGHQDLQSSSAHQYVRIDLRTGSVQSLTEAPISNDAGWWAFGSASWSSDGKEILLPGTFLKSKDNAPSRPCLAIVDLSSNTSTCVWTIKGSTGPGPKDKEEGYYLVCGARFADQDNDRVIVMFQEFKDGVYGSLQSIEHRHISDGTWQVVGLSKQVAAVGRNGLEVGVKQGLNEPPRLVATNKEASRIIWDPNPQLKDIELGAASVYQWKDEAGRDFEGGLYKPSKYKPGRRYPLVIQTHGFMKKLFMPSGLFPTAFAAQELAAEGIAVLQVGEPCFSQTPSEGPCAVSVYEAAAKQLVSEGLADPERIGIIGFSRTCFYVMESLTFGSLRFKAASVTDGVMKGYLQHMMVESESAIAKEDDVMIGPPFGEGLQQWLKHSPVFNLDKVNAPLLVVANGPRSLLLDMWEPYAGLRYLQKPVDLIMLNTDEHVLTSPAARLASQGGSVDWFRYWLQDYEDPDPAKAEQYARWRELRKMQAENEAK